MDVQFGASQVISWFINPMKTIEVIGAINHSWLLEL